MGSAHLSESRVYGVQMPASVKISRMAQDLKHGSKHGLARGLTNYGDPAFSLYLRRSFAKSMGYSAEMLARPVVAGPGTLMLGFG